MTRTRETVRLFDLDLHPVSMDVARQFLIRDAFAGEGSARVVVTPNVDHVVRLKSDASLLALYRRADYTLVDGAPLVIAARLLGLPLRERVTGADLFFFLCADLAKRGGRLFVVGGFPGDEQRIRQTLEERFPGLHVDALSPSMQFGWQEPEAELALRAIANAKPHIVALCLGFPKQELFALRHKEALRCGVVLCVGAALNFLLGREQRAPKVIRSCGGEWLWRLMLNPKRLWRRYLVQDSRFLLLLARELKARIGKRRS